MPKGYRASRSRGGTATLDSTDIPTQETDTMTTVVATEPDVEADESAEDVDPGFEFSMEPAPEGYTPERKTPGRQRRPSFFDDKLRSEEVFGKGWQRVPVTSEEHKAAVIRELNRAKLHLNNPRGGMLEGQDEIGLDLDDKQDDAVYFKSRVAQKRERKGVNDGSNALAENANEEGLNDPEGDNDE